MASYAKWERGRRNGGEGEEGRRKEGSQDPRPEGRLPGDDDDDDPQQRLLSAIAAGDLETVLRLLDAAERLGLDLDRRDVGHDLQTPLMRLCHLSAPSSPANPSAIRHHDDDDDDDEASDARQEDQLEQLLEPVLQRLQRCAWNPNVRDSTGRTLLMHACLAGRLDVALLCLDNGCDAQLLDVDGNSALVYVVRGGCQELLDLFLETEMCRSLLDKANYLGQTPLDIARQLGRDSMVPALLEWSPSPGSSNSRAENGLVVGSTSRRDRSPRGGGPPGGHHHRRGGGGGHFPNTRIAGGAGGDLPNSHHRPFPLSPTRSRNLEVGESQTSASGLRRAASDKALAAARKKKKEEEADGGGGDDEVGLQQRTSPEMARRKRKQQQQQQQQHPHSMADLSSLVSSRNSSRYSTLVVTGSGSSSGGSETRFVVGGDASSENESPVMSTAGSGGGDGGAHGARPGRPQKSREAAAAAAATSTASPRGEGRRSTTRDPPSPRRKPAAANKLERRQHRDAAEGGEGEHSRSPERCPDLGLEGEGVDVSKTSRPPRSKQLQRCRRKNSASLPDLRDFKGKLVTSGEQSGPVEPSASDRPQLPWPARSTPRLKPDEGEGEGRRARIGERTRDKDDGGDDDEKANKTTYLERYKNGDLSASCSLPPLQGLSSPSDVERRKERQKLAHGTRKSNSQEEVMLRSLIV